MAGEAEFDVGKILALHVVDQRQLAALGLVGRLFEDAGTDGLPAEELHGAQAPLACDEPVTAALRVAVHDRRVKQSVRRDIVRQRLELLRIEMLAGVVLGIDVGDGDVALLTVAGSESGGQRDGVGNGPLGFAGDC